MTPPLNLKRVALFSGLSAALFLWIAPMIIMIGVSGLTTALMGESQSRSFLEKYFPFFFLLIALGGGALFGRSLSRLARFTNDRRLMISGGFGFGIPFFATVVSLSMAEAIVVAGTINMPLHILFAILFNGGMLFTSSLHGLAHGIAVKNSRAMIQFALVSGIGGVLGFGLVNLVMDTMGLRVGAPNAAQTATMLTTMILGNIVGAFSGGAALGYVFAKHVQKDSGR